MSLEFHKAQADPIDLFIEDSYRRKKMPLKDFLSDIELRLIVFSLNEANGNQRKAAKILGIKPTTLNEKLKRYKIRFQKTPKLTGSQPTERLDETNPALIYFGRI